jgi:tRNA-specific 2-thiouridylase
VLKLIPETQQVVVGPVDRLTAHELAAHDVTWTASIPEAPFPAEVRIRSRHTAAGALVTPTRQGFHARFHEPQQAIAPGQAAVVYRGDRVIGGGYIAA